MRRRQAFGYQHLCDAVKANGSVCCEWHARAKHNRRATTRQLVRDEARPSKRAFACAQLLGLFKELFMEFLRSSPTATLSTFVASRMAAAQCARWQGASVLPTVVGGTRTRVMIRLWAGIAGDVLALLALGLRFVALCAEQDPDAKVAAQICMPEIEWASLGEHIRCKASYLWHGYARSKASAWAAERLAKQAFVPDNLWGKLTKCVLGSPSTFHICGT